MIVEKGVYLRRLPSMTFLCHAGTITPVRFNTKEEAQARLDHESPEDEYEIWEVSEDDK